MNFKNGFAKNFSNGTSNIKWLFLAFLSLQMILILESLIFFALRAPLPGILHPFLSIICFVLFIFFISRYMRKTANADSEKSLGFLESMLTAITGILLLIFSYLVYSVFALISLKLIPLGINSKSISYLTVLLYLILALCLYFAIFQSVMLFTAGFDFSLKISQMGRAFRIILAASLKKFFSALLYSLISFTLLLLVTMIQYVFEKFSGFITPYGFLQTFLEIIVLCVLYSYTALVTINFARNIIYKSEEKLKNINTSGIPLFAICLLGLSAVMFILVSPLKLNTADAILTKTKEDIKIADYMLNEGLTLKAYKQYESAYSRLLSFKGYVLGMDSIKSNDNEEMTKAMQAFTTAQSFDAENAYAPYFRANIVVFKDKNNVDSALNEYQTASICKDNFPEVNFGLFKCLILKKDSEKSKEILNLILKNKMFYDKFAVMNKLSSKKLQLYIDNISDIEASLIPKLAYKSAEKMKYNNYEAASSELLTYQKLYPKNSDINYLLSAAYSGFKSEQSNYTNVKIFSDAFAQSYDSNGNLIIQRDKEFYKAQASLSINDVQGAVQILSKLYSSDKNDSDVSHLLSYALTRNKSFDEALNITKGLIDKNSKDYFSYFISAMCHLNKNEAATSVSEISKFIDITRSDKKLTRALDEYLYLYSLAYSEAVSNPSALEELEKIKDNALLYNYLKATSSWRVQNNSECKNYIKKVIQADGELGYAYYIAGITSYEETVRTNKSDFKEAENYYLKSLNILPTHTEGYFALAHCYKKWGKNLEALRAFRKVVDLQPYEDHRTDPYGMTVHAIGEISNLQQYDLKEEY